jgi:hypothetical protein
VPRSQLIETGLRGILVVSLLTALFVGLVFLVEKSRLSKASGRIVIGVLLGVGLLFSLFSWAVLAAEIAFAVLVLAIFLRRKFPGFWKWGWIPVAVGLSFAALSWVYAAPVHIVLVYVTPATASPVTSIYYVGHKQCRKSGVVRKSWFTYVDANSKSKLWVKDFNPCGLTPQASLTDILQQLRRDCAVPYFGESNSFVYLGELTRVYRPDICRWDSGSILERSRQKVHLVFLSEKGFLNKHPRTPIVVALHTLTSFGHALVRNL